MAKVSGVTGRGRAGLGWMDYVKVALGSRGLTLEAARQERWEGVESPGANVDE